jgi:hypothetical protein
MQRFSSKEWSIIIPEHWLVEKDNNLLTFFHPDSVGVIQINQLSKTNIVTEADLYDMASEHINAGALTKPIKSTFLFGFTLTFSIDAEFWMQWYLGFGHTVLYITYNCEEQYKETERGMISSIVSSLNLTNRGGILLP